MESVLLDAAGHRRSPATMPGYHHRRHARRWRGPDGARLCALIVMLWRAGLRISEALDLAETDLDRSRGTVLVRRGKGGKRREVGMDCWAWDQLQPWLEIRANLPVGALICVIHGATAGRHWEPSAARKQLRRTAALAGVRRRFAPHHQLRHAHAIEMAHDGVPLVVIQRQLGQPRDHLVGSSRGAAPALPPARFPDSPSEPDMPIPEHPALHRTRCSIVTLVTQRRFPVEWWLGLFRWSPTARGCCGRDSDIGSLVPRRARRASCLRGWSSGAPSTVA